MKRDSRETTVGHSGNEGGATVHCPGRPPVKPNGASEIEGASEEAQRMVDQA